MNALLVLWREKEGEIKRIEKVKDGEIHILGKKENEITKEEKTSFKTQRKAVEAKKKKL